MSEGSAATKPAKFKRINVEISNVCNLKCSFCPAVERGKQVMSAAQFARLAPTLASLTEEVVLHLLGEPLGHPELADIIGVCADNHLPVNIVTNGVLLVGDRPNQLVRPIVRQVSFSLQSFEDNFPDRDPETYIRRILAFVERARRERPDLYVNLRFWDLKDDLAKPRRDAGPIRAILARELGFDWQDVRVNLRRNKSYRLGDRVYLHFDSRFDWPRMDQPIRSTRGYCHGLTGHFGIHADGTVVPCCLDDKAVIALGNAFDRAIPEILESPRAVAMREGFARGELLEDLCQRCTFIERFDGRSRRLERKAACST